MGCWHPTRPTWGSGSAGAAFHWQVAPGPGGCDTAPAGAWPAKKTLALASCSLRLGVRLPRTRRSESPTGRFNTTGDSTPQAACTWPRWARSLPVDRSGRVQLRDGVGNSRKFLTAPQRALAHVQCRFASRNAIWQSPSPAPHVNYLASALAVREDRHSRGGTLRFSRTNEIRAGLRAGCALNAARDWYMQLPHSWRNRTAHGGGLVSCHNARRVRRDSHAQSGCQVHSAQPA